MTMQLSIAFVLLASCFLVVTSYPRNFDVIPKDFYKRQILQPIPGYIPVYIQADGEAVFRRTSDISRGYPVKSVQHKQATSKVAPRVSKTEEKNLKEEKKVEKAEAEVNVDNSKDKIKNSS